MCGIEKRIKPLTTRQQNYAHTNFRQAGQSVTRFVRYAAFLRGINVGGHKPIKMEALRAAFEGMGFQKVSTVLASGNVLFESRTDKAEPASGWIEQKLKTALGHEIGVLVRPVAELKRLAATNFFKDIKLMPETRLYITLLSEKPTQEQKAGLQSAKKDFEFLCVTDREVCSAITVTPQRHTTELMAQLEKQLGRKVTTRNWNTILRLLDQAESEPSGPKTVGAKARRRNQK
jgi:uncharacterized protein (DUF1697 family)